MPPYDQVSLLAHELTHIEQFRDYGVLEFLKIYASDYINGRRAGLDHDAAYRNTRWERMAYWKGSLILRIINKRMCLSGGPV